ncbi:MAG: polyphosphate kinase 2 [Methyloligellaceae bacterium]
MSKTTKSSRTRLNINGQIIDFDIDNPKLPEVIEEGAIGSGGYPYDRRMKRRAYEKELLSLQIELNKMQACLQQQGERLIILFEGRDAAGKGGTIKRFVQHMNSRHFDVVALPKPSDREQGQWYFQRYISHFPTTGEMTFFDRSWYNRAGVERVMKFCTKEQQDKFFEEVPAFEKSLVRDGFRLFKFWLTIGQEMQLQRFHRRRHDPLKHWKLSSIDIRSIPLWESYTEAKNDIFRRTHTRQTPWTIVRTNDKRRGRINALRFVLSQIDYDGKDKTVVGRPDPKIVDRSQRFADQA